MTSQEPPLFLTAQASEEAGYRLLSMFFLFFLINAYAVVLCCHLFEAWNEIREILLEIYGFDLSARASGALRDCRWLGTI